MPTHLENSREATLVFLVVSLMLAILMDTSELASSHRNLLCTHYNTMQLCVALFGV